MKTVAPQTQEDSSEEIAALIETLHQTGQRLEQLTGGEVDSVANRDGQTFLLQHAQDRLRQNESARQAAILNALPASIALLDRQGKILTVNEAWQQFGRANAAHHPGHDTGVNYLTVCDEARGDDAAEAGQAATGIRAVLDGKAITYTLEYPCHSPAEQRWFLMSVTPLAGTSKGAVVMHLNITASRLAENALRESEVRFQRAVAGTNDGIWEWIPATGEDYLSPRWKQLLGYEDHELPNVQESFFNQVHPEDRALAGEAVRAHFEERKPFAVELRLRNKNGEYRWFSSRAQAEWDDQGRPLRMSGSITDINERKLAENALRESERRFSDLLGNVDLVSMMLDREMRITYCNDYLLRLTGWKREEVIGKNWWDIFMPPEMNDLKVTVFAQLLDNQPEALHHENDIVTRSGERRLIRWNNSVLRSGNGEIVGSASIGEDITERKGAEDEIEFKNVILRTQQETSPDAILVVDENNRIISYNQEFVRMWRISPQIVGAGLDAPVLQLVAEQAENLKAFVARVEYLYAHQDDKSQEEIPLKDGRIIDRYSAPMTGAGGRYYGRVWYFRDITERKHMEESLKHVAAKYHTMFEKSSDAIMLFNEEGFFDCNEATLRMFGCPARDDFIGKHPAEFSPPVQPGGDDSMSLANQHIATAIKNGSNLFEWRHRRFEGAEFSAEVLLTAMELDGKTLLQAVVRDITERKTADARIVHLNRVLLVLSSINTLIVRVNDRDELFREACNIAVDAGGFRMAMLVIVDPVTKLPVSITSAGKREELLAEIKIKLSSGEGMQKSLVGQAIRENRAAISNDAQNDPRLSHGKQYTEAGVKSLAVMPLLISGKAFGTIALYASEINFFRKDEMKLLAELAGDIAYAIDHIDKQERLNYLAYYDVLTGLANRTLFLERAGQYMRSADSGGHKLAIGLIDLERFKNINDSLGRLAGDALLKQVAEWLTRFAHDAGLLARIDADHFAFVVPEIKADGNLAKLVDSIVKAFQAHLFRVNGTELRLAAKTGIAVFPDDGTDAETVYGNAEAALKAAKKGGDRYLFHAKKMTEAVTAKLTLENQLRQAIDNEEFVLHYQPKVNLLSGNVTSAEALIRWNDPRTGLVPPGKFIPVLEETGLISEVGRWALRRAITDYLRWRAAGLPAVRIAVNVSPLQLRNIHFIDEIKQVISLDEHAAAGLELEITESLIMDNVGQNIATLKEIRVLGVTIAIDDFGTGFSSLSYLAKLPVDTLKIDRAFVIEMDKPEGIALVSTVIIMAHALKLKVVAEGVETEQQSRQLLSLNCDEMQGFLFSKPVPAEIFEAKFLAPLAPGGKQ